MSEINFNALKSFDGSVSEGDFNKLVDAMARLVLNNGVGYTVRRNSTGTVIQTSGGGLGAAKCPFAVTLSAIAGDSDNLSVSVRPGTVNQFVADNVFDTFTISKTGTFYVKASITTDGQNITSFSIAVDSSSPATQDATASSLPTSFDVLIAIVKDSKAFKTLGCGSISLTPVQAFITDKSSPASPGELTYIPYYIWQVGVV